MTNNNPLQSYFRQPKIYARLPSGGAGWEDGSIVIPTSGELPVYAMTISDEISLKTPDALMSGDAVANIIKSCIPSIIDPWAMPNWDMDYLLIASRLATYGDEMELTGVCPECKHRNDRTLNLVEVLDQISIDNFTHSIQFNQLTINFKPLTFKSVNEMSQKAFEQQRLIEAITNPSIPEEERLGVYKNGMDKLIGMQVRVIVDSIESINTGKDSVTDRDFITEFLNNLDVSDIKNLRDVVNHNKGVAGAKPILIQCEECEHQWEAPISFEMSTFFG